MNNKEFNAYIKGWEEKFLFEIPDWKIYEANLLCMYVYHMPCIEKAKGSTPKGAWALITPDSRVQSARCGLCNTLVPDLVLITCNLGYG